LVIAIATMMAMIPRHFDEQVEVSVRSGQQMGCCPMSSDLPMVTAGDNEPTKWLVLMKLIEAYVYTLRDTLPGEDNSTEQSQIINITNRLLGPGSSVTSHIAGPSALHDEGEIEMGDIYTAGQAAAFGPHAQAHDVTFTQVWNQISATIDLPQLENELGALRQALKKQASLPEHDIAIAEVASAEIAAKNRDGNKVIEHLRKAGKWVRQVAIDTSCELAASVITKALGM
jgi:hypothetical protein